MVEHVDEIADEGQIVNAAVAEVSVDTVVPASAVVIAPGAETEAEAEAEAEAGDSVTGVAAQIADLLFVLGVVD